MPRDGSSDEIRNGMRADRAGLKTIAVFEAFKGGLVLLAAAGLISLVHQRGQEVAEEIVRDLHLNPASHYPHIFLDAAASLNSTRLWLLAGGACLYTSIRFLESYGLWHERTWAEWLGAVSGFLYIPIEVYELFRHVTAIRITLLLANIGIVLFLAWTIYRHRNSGDRPLNPRIHEFGD
jgi:uncharacterized membrane protein (DUF2068 family)